MTKTSTKNTAITNITKIKKGAQPEVIKRGRGRPKLSSLPIPRVDLNKRVSISVEQEKKRGRPPLKVVAKDIENKPVNKTPEMQKVSISTLIKMEAARRNWTLTEMAYHCGYSFSAVYAWSIGSSIPRTDVILDVCSRLNLKVSFESENSNNNQHEKEYIVSYRSGSAKRKAR